MKRFSCPNCANEVHFDNVTCVICGTQLGYRPEIAGMADLGADQSLVRCGNAAVAGCNWLLPEGETQGYCRACRHNNVVPDPQTEFNRTRWADIELAKRHLFYALLRWRLRHPTKEEDPRMGLAFDFLADKQNPDGTTTPVLTGHEDGLITINIAEGDDVIRAERQSAMEEPYRTLIGHMRHEVGHYYWALLVDNGPYLDEFRQLFGDEREDYGQALQRYYDYGAPANWSQTHISAYATSHAWEDWAETWAHWMHIVDGIETASAYGILLDGGAVRIEVDPYLSTDIDPLIEAWVPLTVALNNMNRGMGQPDLYPFVLSRSVVEKLRFINRVIHASAV